MTFINCRGRRTRCSTGLGLPGRPRHTDLASSGEEDDTVEPHLSERMTRSRRATTCPSETPGWSAVILSHRFQIHLYQNQQDRRDQRRDRVIEVLDRDVSTRLTEADERYGVSWVSRSRNHLESPRATICTAFVVGAEGPAPILQPHARPRDQDLGRRRCVVLLLRSARTPAVRPLDLPLLLATPTGTPDDRRVYRSGSVRGLKQRGIELYTSTAAWR